MVCHRLKSQNIFSHCDNRTQAALLVIQQSIDHKIINKINGNYIMNNDTYHTTNVYICVIQMNKSRCCFSGVDRICLCCSLLDVSTCFSAVLYLLVILRSEGDCALCTVRDRSFGLSSCLSVSSNAYFCFLTNLPLAAC